MGVSDKIWSDIIYLVMKTVMENYKVFSSGILVFFHQFDTKKTLKRSNGDKKYEIHSIAQKVSAHE